MRKEYFGSTDFDGARREVLAKIRRYRDENVIYFDGWRGFGAAPVLRSVAQELRSIKAKKTPPELCFDRILYIDCSAWESKRVMQRKIAKKLKLDHETMFDKQDEKDDYNGVDKGSRDVIRSVTQVIDQTLVYKKIIMVFLNGSDEEIDVTRFGFSPNSRDHVILWTFKRLYLTVNASHDEIASRLRYTNIFLNHTHGLPTSSEFRALLREEAANIVARHPWMRSNDLTMVMECCLYELFLQYSFHSATGFGWVAHSPNYWTCDGIIKGDIIRKISDTLHQEIHWEHDDSRLGEVFAKPIEDPETPFLVVDEEVPFFKKRQHRWVFVTSKNMILHEDMKAILESASSLFVALETSDGPQGLRNGFLKHCSNLGVLILTCCAFNFVSPPFLQCHGLRFLGLDHCTHDDTSEGQSDGNWTCLHNLWVLDLRYTEWDEILSEEKMDIMTNLRELNVEGFMCWQLTSRLHGKLPYLQKLRIIKPTHKAEMTSIDCYNSLMDKKDLEILDLSGNREMENICTSFSMAKSIQMVILDGCDGLENVVVPDGLRSSIRSFSFDGYGPANHWTSSFKLPLESPGPMEPPDTDKRYVKKTSKISLQGCTQLDNLFVRELPNLVELDISGCAIKVLDFTTMVKNVPMLKRLFLLGCQNLRAIIWRPRGSVARQINLELVCIDTRYKRAHGFTRPSLAQHKHFGFQLHAVLMDVRLARTLYDLITLNVYRRGYEDTYFNIHFTSSVEFECGQVETTGKEMSKPSMEQHLVRVSNMYDDVFFKIGDAPMLVFPQPPNQESDHHIQISDGSHDLESELTHSDTLSSLMRLYVESIHEHDTLTSASMPAGWWQRPKWCRIERCPNIVMVFPPNAYEDGALRTIWASDLLKAECIWTKGFRWSSPFRNLQHLHLRSCPRLEFVLPVWVASFPSLETLHIIRCSNLTHVFVLDEKYPEKIVTHGVQFPKLTTVHLHDLPKLQQIMCDEVKMLAPALETIRIRGCFGLRRLPALQGREPGVKRPSVEMEKDVWDALEWDGLAAGHHSDLFEPPVHSRYYRRRRLLRRTVLR